MIQIQGSVDGDVRLDIYTTFNAALHSKPCGENGLVYSYLVHNIITSVGL